MNKSLLMVSTTLVPMGFKKMPFTKTNMDFFNMKKKPKAGVMGGKFF